jgi:hypothetical protein
MLFGSLMWFIMKSSSHVIFGHASYCMLIVLQQHFCCSVACYCFAAAALLLLSSMLHIQHAIVLQQQHSLDLVSFHVCLQAAFKCLHSE